MGNCTQQYSMSKKVFLKVNNIITFQKFISSSESGGEQ